MESDNKTNNNPAAVAALQAAMADENNAFARLCCGEGDIAELLARGGEGPLFGLPVGVKDNINVAGVEMNCGSRLLEGYVPAEDACVVERMRRAGMVILGKTNLDEFAMGSSGLLSVNGPVRNPRDGGRYAGGSSSGSAAAVAAGIVPLALGSDTGGSVRVPAAYCGVAGYKPTWGAVSRRGMVSHASSLDCVGIIGKNVRLCAQLMAAISGRDEGDETSFDLDVPVTGQCGDIRGLRVGIWTEQMAIAAPDAQAAVLEACQALSEAGAVVTEISCHAYDMAAQAYLALSTSEVASCLGRFDGLRYGAGCDGGFADLRGELLGAEVRGRLILGSALMGMDEYHPIIFGAQRRRAAIREEMAELFGSVDIVVGPTVVGPAPRLGEKRSASLERLADAFAAVANLAGLPALTVPCGSSEGMPLAVQLMGPHGSDALVLSAGAALEDRVGVWRG